MGLGTFLPEGLQGLQLPVLAATAVGVSGALCLYLLSRSKRGEASKDAPSPPSPPGSWWLGSMAHAPVFGNPRVHAIIHEWACTYGGVFNVLCKGPWHVVTDASIAGPLLCRGELCLPKAGWLYQLTNEFISMGSNQMFSEADEQSGLWRSFRKTMAPCFSTDNVRKKFPVIKACADTLVERWAAHEAKGVPVDAWQWMNRATLQIIGDAGFEYSFDALHSSVAEGEEHAFLAAMHENLLQIGKVMENPLHGPGAKLLPFLPYARKLRAHKENVKQLFTTMYESIKSRGEPDPSNQSIAANLMRVKNPETGEAWPDEVVAANLAILVVAGFDTTSMTCMWALYDIARHPDIQRRIAQELAGAGLLQVQGRPPARQLEWADLTALPYFNMVLKESMRLHTVPAAGVFRVAHRDITLDGLSIRKGQQVWVPFYALHNSPINFTQPATFDPERWRHEAESEGKEGAAHAEATASSSKEAAARCSGNPLHAHATPSGHALAKSKAWSFMPFGEGPRGCIGKTLALADARTILLSILSRFFIELDPSVGDHAEVEAGEYVALVLNSGRPIKLRLRPHA